MCEGGGGRLLLLAKFRVFNVKLMCPETPELPPIFMKRRWTATYITAQNQTVNNLKVLEKVPL